MPAPTPIGEKIPWYLKQGAVTPLLVVLAVLLLASSLGIAFIPRPWGAVTLVSVIIIGTMLALLYIALMLRYEGKWHTYRSKRKSLTVIITESTLSDGEVTNYSVLPTIVTMTNGHNVTLNDRPLGEIGNAKAFTYRRRFVKGQPETADVVLETE
ncbi:MAG: hypothetical protein WBP22_00795 [Candidatus Saccharimonas sp.]